MPPTLTYPGVYIVEAPSSVHTITGVATSIGAFFGQAAMGPLNTPVECLSYADYTRTFGAPVGGALLAQSVQQFFSNGGSDCYVVRLASGAYPAQLMLLNLAKQPVLQVSAASAGAWGSGLLLTVDYATAAPDSTFNLQVQYVSGGTVVQTESFGNLSMDPNSPRYAPTFLTQSSQLITATPGSTIASGVTAGYSEARLPFVSVAASGWGNAIAGIFPAVGSTGSFQISVDGGPWTQVNLLKGDLQGATEAVAFAYIQNAINTALGASSGTSVAVPVLDTFGTLSFLRVISSGSAKTSVQVRRASSNDIAQALMFGVDQGGIEVTKYSDLRPVPTGISFTVANTGEIDMAMDQLASATLGSVTQAQINSLTPVAISLTSGGPDFYQGSGTRDDDGVRENLQQIANAINTGFPGYQAVVAGYRLFIRNLRPSSPITSDAFTLTTTGNAAPLGAGFTANVAQYQLGSAGTTYSQTVLPAPTDGSAPGLVEYQGSELARTGLYALDGVDLFNLMVISGDGLTTSSDWDAVRSSAAVYCQSRRAFLLLDAPAAWTSSGLPSVQASDVQNFRAAIGEPMINCAVFYPRVQFNDGGTLRYIGPSGMMAGVFAATDSARGVWKAPAGTNAALTGVTGLEVILTDGQNGILNPLGVDCIRRMPSGYVSWGARTVAGYDNSGTQWTYIPIRRTALFLEESLYRGTQWAVFEPNDDPLWAQIRMNLNAFMMGLFRQGAFQGTTPQQAFFVKCDSETTTQADIDQGVVNIVVGFAPLVPAEFVVITIQQIVGNLS